MTRDQRTPAGLPKVFSSWDITRLASGASDRRYFRAARGSRSVVIAVYSDGRTQALERFLYWSRELASVGIRVPEVLDVLGRCVVLTDLGRDSLQRITLSGRLTEEMVRQAAEMLGSLRQLPVAAYRGRADDRSVSLRKYVDQLLACKRDLHRRGASRLLSRRDLSFLNGQLDSVLAGAAAFSKGQGVLAFWDFHSKNLFWCNNAMYVIDYQDIRVTSPDHDTAALMYDPYVGGSLRLRRMFARASGAPDSASLRQYARQRLLHAITVYLDMVNRRRRRSYLEPLTSAIGLLHALNRTRPSST